MNSRYKIINKKQTTKYSIYQANIRLNTFDYWKSLKQRCSLIDNPEKNQ